jgi:membrane protein DedA with SNARE-associated domain
MNYNSDVAAGFARHILTIAGGYLVSQGITDEGTMAIIVGGLASLIGVIWSWKSKTTK